LIDSTCRDELSRRWNDCARLATRIAHDFDNVLTGVNGFAELAAANLAATQEAHGYMQEILRATRRAAEFTDRLHLLQTCGVFRPNPTAIAPVLHRLDESVRRHLQQGVELVTRVAANTPMAGIHAEPLFCAVNQLLTNAVEACGNAGAVKMEAGPRVLDDRGASVLFGNIQPGAFVEIRIDDSGPGIAPEVQSRLLVEPLFTTKFRHRGLGLAIAFRALSAHGGGFCLESGAASGTTARILMPVA
jgi:signal transduction histidine kinase